MYKLAPTIRLNHPAPRSILTSNQARTMHLKFRRLRREVSSHILDSMHRTLDRWLSAGDLEGLDSHTLSDLGVHREEIPVRRQ